MKFLKLQRRENVVVGELFDAGSDLEKCLNLLEDEKMCNYSDFV